MSKVKAKITKAQLEKLSTGGTLTINLPPRATVLEIVYDDAAMQVFNSMLEKIFKR